MRSRLMKNLWLTFVSTVVIVLAISIFTSTTATPRFYYSVTDLGTLNDNRIISPSRINDLGQVIGESSDTPNGTSKASAFLWQNGNITNLGTLGGDNSIALDINNSGQVVGNSLTSSGQTHAFLWQNGTMTDLGTPDGDETSFANGINNSGQIVGYSYQASDLRISHALLWKNGGRTDLGTLSGDNFSQALTINNQGQIFGLSGGILHDSTIIGRHIFKWQNGVMTNLGDLFPSSNQSLESSPIHIQEINNKGQVVFISAGVMRSGRFGNVYSTVYAAFLSQNGIVTDLGNLGGISSRAYGINTAGTVVGSSSINSDVTHAFIWRNGKMRDLNNLLPADSGWELNQAVSINNKGQIVGTGTFNGQSRGFLATPVTVSN